MPSFLANLMECIAIAIFGVHHFILVIRLLVIFQSTEEEDQEIEANAEFQNAQWTDGICPSLQVVKMNGTCFRSNEMCFIELVLSKATALRTMSISLGSERYLSTESALSQVNTYRRASPHAQVFFS